MNILLLGNGGREHALAWKIAQSPKVSELFIAPGNAGTQQIGKNININLTNFKALADFALENKVDMIVVGPEIPLVEGLVDYFKQNSLLSHISIIGPSKAGAQLEGSKDFAKAFMKRHSIPTAAYASFDKDDLDQADRFLEKLHAPYVLKADGLAGGKGVLIVDYLYEAKEALRKMFDGQFGKSSEKVVIEEYLSGVECSVFVLTDGKNYKILPEAKDYKRIGEGDTGLNTGGMGSVSPVSFATPEWMQKVEDKIIKPTIDGLIQENIDYKGFIFFGLMNCQAEPKVIEYNCRMGDPETEVVMLRLKTDIVDLFEGVVNGNLSEYEVEYDSRSAVCMMLVSAGYPEQYLKGLPISFPSISETLCFHAGTRAEEDKILTDGGRVIAVTAYGINTAEALSKAKNGAEHINFEGKYFRRDIGEDLI